VGSTLTQSNTASYPQLLSIPVQLAHEMCHDDALYKFTFYLLTYSTGQEISSSESSAGCEAKCVWHTRTKW